jgi:hypothetical protein
MDAGLAAGRDLNLTLGKAVCYNFSFPTCAAAATVQHEDERRTLF